MYFTPLTKDRLTEIIDTKSQTIIKYYISKALFAEPEPMHDLREVSFRVPNEHIEQWIAQSIGGRRIGSGSYPIDLLNPSETFGADIAIVTAKTDRLGNHTLGLSGEKSIGQKFSDTEWSEDNQSLDQLFNNREIYKIAENSNNIFYKKFSSITNDYENLQKIYYFFVIIHSEENKFYLFGLEVNYQVKQDIGKPLIKGSGKEVKNVILDNFIRKKFGEVVTYKSKKRMELRLRTKFLVENNFCITFNIDKNRELISLRDLSQSEIKDLYIKESVEQFNKVNEL